MLISIFCIVFNGKATSYAVTYTYNNLDRLTKIDYNNGKYIEYQYDNAGNIMCVLSVVHDSDNDGMPDN